LTFLRKFTLSLLKNTGCPVFAKERDIYTGRDEAFKPFVHQHDFVSGGKLLIIILSHHIMLIK
jgi:hypothetical protein